MRFQSTISVISLAFLCFLAPASWAKYDYPTAVISHGYGGPHRVYNSSLGTPLVERLRENGVRVIVLRTDAFATFELAFQQAVQQLDEELHPDEEVFWVGHSQGGLNGRYFIGNNHRLAKPKNIVKITTIGTPHLGPMLHSDAAYLAHFIFGPEGGEAAQEMSPENMIEFNKLYPMHPDVDYASVGTVHEDWSFGGLTRLIGRLNGNPLSDGLVSLESATYGRQLLKNGKPIVAGHINQMFRMPRWRGRQPAEIVAEVVWEDFQNFVENRHLCNLALTAQVGR